MTITDKLLTPGSEHGRSGAEMAAQGVVVHYVGNPGSTALANRNYFENGSNGNHVSAHYIVGLQGEVLRCVPEDERAAHAGKSYAAKYDGMAKTNNARYIGVETCHPDAAGKFTQTTYAALIELLADIFKRRGWGVGDVDARLLRHYDVCGKSCPLYYVKNPTDWETLRADVKTELGQAAEPETVKTPILAKPTATAEQMRQWAASKGAKSFFAALAPTYYVTASKAGVNPAIAYCQAALETGFGKFGGVLDESYHNLCGMKTATGGGDADKDAHMRFVCWEDGAAAHVDHLALYAGAAGYPCLLTKDPRHFPSIRGTAPCVEDLTGKWASDPNYAAKIIKMVRELESMPAAPTSVGLTLDEAVKIFAQAGIMASPEYWAANASKLAYLPELLVKAAEWIKMKL